jgi:hypothetical protein
MFACTTIRHTASKPGTWMQPHRLARLGGRVLRHQIDRTRGMKADVIEIQGVREQQSVARRERMIRPHHQHQIVITVVKNFEAARLGFACANADLCGTLLNTPDHLPARPLLQVDLQEFMGVEKAGQILGQELHDRRQVGEHADVPADTLRVLGQFDGDFFDIQKRDAGMVQQCLSRRRQRHALREPLEQGHAKCEFEIGHPLLLTADAAMPSRAAARVRFCSSQTAMNSRNVVRSIRRSSALPAAPPLR